MTNRTTKTAPLLTARVTGLLMLLLVFLGPFSILYVPAQLIVFDDATATANRIMAASGLFRAALASDALIVLIEVALSALLYVLLKPANPTLSLVAAFARLGMTIIQGINLLNYFFVLLLLSGAGYLTAFRPDQLPSLVLLFLNGHEAGVLIWGLFFGFHLAVSGYLVYASGYIPKWVGILLLVTASYYLIQGFGNLLFPAYKTLIANLSLLAMAEIAFPVWLLIKGVNVEGWKKQALASM